MLQLSRRAALSCAALLLATGCGSGGGGDSNPGPDYLPLATGNRWVADDGSGSQITGQRTVDGQPWWVSAETDAGGTPAGEALLASDAQGVRLHTPAQTPVPAFTATLVRLPVVVGDRYPGYRLAYTSSDFDSNGTADNVEASTDVEVVGFERVVTPAGTFDNALHLRLSVVFTVVYQPSGTREAYSSGTSDLWYAAGIGPVRRSSSITTQGVTETLNNVLAGYRVGNRSGGTLPGP